jgi:hypothetical protein
MNEIKPVFNLNETPDRIHFSMARKISDGNFGSYDINFSYTTDLDPDESVTDGFRRAVTEVRKPFNAVEKQIFDMINQPINRK